MMLGSKYGRGIRGVMNSELNYLWQVRRLYFLMGGALFQRVNLSLLL